MKYRLNKQDLFDTLTGWNSFLNRKVHLVACGGTALTLMGIKDTTKDVDFMVPVSDEYDYLTGILKKLGYERTTSSGWCRRGEQYIFDLFRGKRIHTTELLRSPLTNEGSAVIKEWTYIQLARLNGYDLITSKLFRGTTTDYEDCIALIKARKSEIDIEKLKRHFFETASYDVSKQRIKKDFEFFMKKLVEEGLHNG